MGATSVEARAVGLVACPSPTVATTALALALHDAAADRGLDVRLLPAGADGRLPAAQRREVARWHGVVSVSCAGSPKPPALGERRVVLDAVPSQSGWLRTRVAHVVPDDDGAARHLGRAMAAQAHAVVAVAAVGSEADVATRWTNGLRPTLGRLGQVALAWSASPSGAADRLQRILAAPPGSRPSVVAAMSDETASLVRSLLRAVDLDDRVRVLTRTADDAEDGGWGVRLPVRAMVERALDLLAGVVTTGAPPHVVTTVPFVLAAPPARRDPVSVH